MGKEKYLVEKFNVNINAVSPKRSKYSKWYALIVGTIWIIIGLIEIFNNKTRIFYYIYFFLGVGYIIGYPLTEKISHKFHITFDDKGKETQTSLFKRSNITWDAIKSIQITILEIKIKLKNGTEENIDLSYLDYLYVKTTKEKIKEFADDKGIDIS